MRDPVARSIRNQQMQDAVPSPEERERQRHKYLQDNGCRFCGEDDPDKLEGVQVLLGNCMGGDPCDVVYCDDCGFDSDFFERWLKIKGKRRTNDVIVIYDCGESRGYETPEPRTEMVEVCIGHDDNGDPVYEECEQEVHTPSPPTPDIPAWCPVCEADIDTTIRTD